MHHGKRYRMPADDFAFARGATASVTSKQDAEKVWEPKFIAEIASGKDPRIVPARVSTAGRPTTVADLFKLYRERYVEVERLKSRHTAAELGQLPTRALGRPEAIEDFKHDLRHEALSRLADEGVPVHELQFLAGHANITTTQRYMNARANSLAESMPQARERRVDRLVQRSNDNVQVG
jgi:hypothetical protein